MLSCCTFVYNETTIILYFHDIMFMGHYVVLHYATFISIAITSALNCTSASTSTT